MTKKNRARPQRRSSQPSAAKRPPTPSASMVDADSERDRRPESNAFPTYRHNWWSDRGEWARGKAELLWETRLAPFLGWLGTVPLRLFGGWSRAPRISGHSRRRAQARFLWSWEEQGVRMLKQTARLGLAIVASAVLLVALVLVGQRVAGAIAHVKSPTDGFFGAATTTTAPNTGAVTISNNGDNATVPPAPAYTLGMWTSNMTPGGETTIYARVSQADSSPVAGVTVSVYYNGRGLAANTNAFGLATFAIPATGARGQPVTVSGTVRINGQEIDAETFYTPN